MNRRQEHDGSKLLTLMCLDAGITHRSGLGRHRRLADIADPATRTRKLRGIKGRDTQPELAVRQHLHSTGLRYRLPDKRLLRRPNIVLPGFDSVVCFYGCFWHRH
ncbi:MAG: hypothetical protein AB9M53_02415 [Leptothrix sp. (in: b-proteobacteria)]